MKTGWFLSALLSFSIFGLSAQNASDAKLPLLKFSDIYLVPGGQFYSPASASKSEFLKLAPESELLKADMSTLPNQRVTYTGGLAEINLMAGFQLADREKGEYRNNVQLRFGISYGTAILLDNFYSSNERFAFDTLVSTQTGKEFYVDSIKTNGYNMNYYRQHIGLSSSVIWRTNSSKRWSIYGGAGISVNYSLKSYTAISHWDNGYVQYPNSLAHLYDNQTSTGTYVREEHENKNSLGGSAFLPMGLDLRMGKDKKFWQHMHLFLEAQPGIGLVNIPELGGKMRTYTFVGFGLRYSS